MEKSISIRDEVFQYDMELHGAIQSQKIVIGAAKHSSDKKWITRQAFALKRQIQEMNGDKLIFESRVNTLINKTLKTIPEEHRKDYAELLESITSVING